MTTIKVFGRSRHTLYEIRMRRQRLLDAQRRTNADIIAHFSKLIENQGTNPAFTFTIYGLKDVHTIRCAAWTGTGSTAFAACPIREQLLTAFEAEVRPRHNCAEDDAYTACEKFWYSLIRGNTCGSVDIFRGCGWRYEDASGRVLVKA